MKTGNIVQEKSYSFAIDIVNLYKKLVDKKEYLISKQLFRSGTSVGANIEEAIGAQSRKDFISKMSIAYKEIRETFYWLNILKDTQYIDQNTYERYEHKTLELLRLIGKIIKSSKI